MKEKNERKRNSFSLYQLQRPCLLFFSVFFASVLFSFLVSAFLLFLFSFSSASLFFFLFFGSVSLSFLFSSCVSPFQPKNISQPKTFLCSTQNLFQFNPKHFFSAQNVFASKAQRVAPLSSAPPFFLCVPPSQFLANF